MAAKIQLSSKKITPFGGIEFLSELFKKHQISQKIDNQLGMRNDNAKYSFGQLFMDQTFTHFCGGSRMEDTIKLKDNGVSAISEASPDTLARAMQELAVPDTIYTSKHGIEHSFNYNDKLNNLLVNMASNTGMISKNEKYILDYDNSVLETSKNDAKPSYKGGRGYQPGVAYIDKLPVFVCNRNGNSNATYRQLETLENCFNLLANHEVAIDRFRADSASCQVGVINYLENAGIKFFIRYKNSDAEVEYQSHNVKQWEEVHLKRMSFEVGEVPIFSPFENTKECRLIITRIKRKDGTQNLFSKDSYSYHGIISNDEQMSAKEIALFYNQRGTSEKNFDILKNDFNWKYLPFSSMSCNTVYMILTSLNMILFEWAKKILSVEFNWVEKKMRLKRFIFNFITVAGQWIKRGRQKILKLFTPRQYRSIWQT